MKRFIVSGFMLILGIGLLWTAGRMNRPLLEGRATYRLDSTAPLDNAPPLVAFTTVALGGFRGVIADMLWIRASDMQDEGRYFEIMQLADWITKLEPRSTDVWAFHAWNMAYNISAAFPDPADRWRWVYNGLRLLRDDGLACNPGDPLLYRELGWIYQNKIGGRWDEDAMYYRRQLANQMAELFDGPRPDYARMPAASPGKARRMREEYKLDPELMQAVEKQYGPLDWRAPETHAVYWGFRGQKAARTDSIECDRLIYQSLAQSFRQGGVIFDRDKGVFVVTPDLGAVWGALRAYEHVWEHHQEEGVQSAYSNFLNEAILDLYSCGESAEAGRVYEVMKSRWLTAAAAPAGLDAYVELWLAKWFREGGKAEASAFAGDCEFRAFFWKALGQEGRAAALDRFALRIWNMGAAGAATPAAEFGRVRSAARAHALSVLPSPYRERVAERP